MNVFKGVKLPKTVVEDGVKWLIMPCKIILDCLSVWPERQTNTTDFLNFLCVSSFAIAVVGQINYITDKNVDLGSMAYAISFLVLSIETTVRRVLLLVYRARLKDLLMQIYYEFWPSDLLGKQLHQEISRTSWYLLIYCASYTCVAFTWGLQIVIITFFDRNLPLRTKFPFRWEKSPYYELLYIWESFMSLELAFNVCALDLFFVSLLAICIAQFRLLSSFLQTQMKQIPELREDVAENCSGNFIKGMEVLIKCVDRHNKLMCACKEIEAIFTVFILVQYLTSIGTVCLSTFVATALPKEIVTALTYFLGHISEIFIYCYMGENLIIESMEFSNAVFECGWHLVRTDTKLQKSLVLIMVRSQRAVRMSAGGFGFLSISSFLKLVQFSFSVFTLLHSMMSKQKLL